jgi:hypothetical protein
MRGGGDLVCGNAYKSLCKYNYDDRYDIKAFDDTLQEGDKVFLNLSNIEAFIAKPPDKKVTLFIGNSDTPFDDEKMKSVHKFATKVYAMNCSASTATQIPMGFRDDMYVPHQEMKDVLNGSASSDKKILCLANFLIETSITKRVEAKGYFESKPWVQMNKKYMDNTSLGKSKDFKDPDTKKMRSDYYVTLKQTKFVVCPQGTGMDTHRVYESLFFGCIPIILSSPLDPMYEKLGGCWVVKAWGDVTEESCNAKWAARGTPKILLDPAAWL